jgi:hypothetical protein
MKYFKPKSIEEAEYTFAVQHVSLIQDMQRQLQAVTIQLPLEKIQPSLVDELVDMCTSNAGDTPLFFEVYDETKQNLIKFRAAPVKMSSEFYHWLQLQRLDDTLDFNVQL